MLISISVCFNNEQCLSNDSFSMWPAMGEVPFLHFGTQIFPNIDYGRNVTYNMGAGGCCEYPDPINKKGVVFVA